LVFTGSPGRISVWTDLNPSLELCADLKRSVV
jgi:hypothetical protein